MRHLKFMAAPLLTVFMTLCYPQSALAQTVSVQNDLGEHGFGWMFAHGGVCHVAMPRHVAGPFPRVTLSTAAPVESASATMIAPFWETIDLAVGVVRGGLEGRCTGKLDDLEENMESVGAASGELLRLSPSGDLERSAVRIMDRKYLTFEGILEQGGPDIAQGTSGAFVFTGDRPIGMALTSTGSGQATFIRSGEMLIHLRRFLNEQGGAHVDLQTAAVPTPSEPGTLPLVFHSASIPPVSPRFAPENMTAAGQFVFAPAQHMSFVFGFKENRMHPVSRLKLESAPSDGQTMPRDVLLRWSFDDLPNGFRSWTRGQVARDGLLDTGPGTSRNMRWIELIVLDAWSGGDIVIDEITVY